MGTLFTTVTMSAKESDDKATEEFLAALDEFNPTIPDDVIEHFLERSGFAATDTQMKRLVSLAAQKFISDVSNDAVQYSKLRQAKEKSKSKDLVLRMEDLSQALLEYGINVNKPA